ncbi:hypothetical protein BJ742DRAFT_832193 [Cladochytrium replicatum]|nr:hypothetical protein BJ742DRAFT_832193 [Cladochytrium replicatum]
MFKYFPTTTPLYLQIRIKPNTIHSLRNLRARMILWSTATLRPQLQQFLESHEKDVAVPDLPIPLQKRLNSIVAAMSLTRTVIRIFHWLEPIEQMFEGDPTACPDDRRVRDNVVLRSTACNVAGDINCLAQIGALGSKTGTVWGRHASQLWLTCIWRELYEVTKSFCRRLHHQEERSTTPSPKTGGPLHKWLADYDVVDRAIEKQHGHDPAI